MKRPAPEDPPWTTLRRALFTPVDASSIVFFRVTFGLLMAWKLRTFLWEDYYQLYTRPPLLFKYYGLEWVSAGPEWAMKILFWIMAVAALGIAVGFLYRISATVFFLGELYVFCLDAARNNNHDYLICLLAFLLIFIPAHRAGSLDAALRSGLRLRTMPSWALWLLRFQIGVPYFFGGLAKLNADWLLRAQPMSVWLQKGGAKVPEVLQTRWAGYAFSWGGLAFDLLVVPLLLFRRTRVPTFLLVVGFHLSNATIFDIGVFPWLMICATMIFMPPDWPQRMGLVSKSGGPAPARRRKESTAWSPKERLAAVLLVAWVAVQVLAPLRHFLYPGNVDWTEEGRDFAWRMKLRDKRGTVRFVVVDRASRKATLYDGLAAVLTERQYLHLLHDPYMILQFAHHLGRELAKQGQDDVEIRALTSISFNGREEQPMIDPNVDLTTRQRRLAAADWIAPLVD